MPYFASPGLSIIPLAVVNVPPGLYPVSYTHLEGIINTAASSYQWFRNNFARNYSYKELDSLAQKAAQKNDRAYFYPYLAGMTSPFWGNGTGCFSGLSLGSGVGQLALSVMDGVSCNIKANLDKMCIRDSLPSDRTFRISYDNADLRFRRSGRRRRERVS